MSQVVHKAENETPRTEGADHPARRRVRRGRRPERSAFRKKLAAIDDWLDASGANLCLGLVATSIISSVLAIGTVHVTTLILVAPIALSAGAIALWTQRKSLRELPPPALIIAALALFTLLQALPLPLGLVEAIAPHNAATWSSALETTGMMRGWVPLSVDPGATLVEALKWLCYASIFVGAAFVSRIRGTQWALLVLFGAALAVALITVAHKAAAATAVYGLYHPEFANPSFSLSPLLNENNLAGYLNLGAFTGLALLVSRKQLGPRWLLAIAVSIVVAVSTLAASRGGWISLLSGLPLLFVVLFRARKTGGRAETRVLIGVQLAAIGGGLGLFALGASERVWQSLQEQGLKKLELLAWSGPMISEHRWVGVGRGAFETSFPAYRGDVGHHLYAHAENFVAQWCAEWGVVIAAGALFAFAWFLRPKSLGTRRSTAAATAAIGVVVLLVHNLVDLALELASVGIALFALLGALWGGAAASRARDRSSSGRRSVLPAIALAASGIALLITVAIFARTTALDDRRELARRGTEARAAGAAENQALLDEVAMAMRRHPADPFLPLIGASAAYRSDKNPLPWLARAIERDPMSGRPHIVLAHVLANRGARGQALLAIRMAVEREHLLTQAGAELAIKLGRNFGELASASPAGTKGAELLLAMARMQNTPDKRALRTKLLDEAIARDPALDDAVSARVDDLLSDLETKATNCQGDAVTRCTDRIVELSNALARAKPDSDRPIVLRARLELALGHAAEAREMLAKGCQRISEHLECWRWRVVATEKAEPKALGPVLDGYLELACASSVASKCSAAAAWLGDLLAAREDWEAATRMYERAAREGGDRAAWERLAKAATRAGQDSLAMRAWQRASTSHRGP